MAHRLLSLCILASFHLASFSQVTIWSENFNSYSDGTTTGSNNNSPPTTVDWTSGGCTTCPSSSADYWEIRSGAMEARDVNNELVFLDTEVIDISGFTVVRFRVTVGESGDHEGPYLSTDDCTDQANEDFANVSYRIDGGAWNLIGNFLGWCGLYASCNTHTLYGDDGTSGDCRSTDVDWGTTTVSQTGLSGSTLEIRLEATNSAGSEFITFDDILVQGMVVLPIELLTFTATTPTENQVQLDWSTASETNNDFFTIERSAPATEEGFNWKVIATLPGAGNSDKVIHYNTMDYRPIPGRSFYRLKQTDFDGQFAYSDIATVVTDLLFKIYPNPTSGSLFVQVADETLESYSFKLFNVIGQEVNFRSHLEESGWRLQLDHLPAGIYLINVMAPGTLGTEYIVVR